MILVLVRNAVNHLAPDSWVKAGNGMKSERRRWRRAPKNGTAQNNTHQSQHVPPTIAIASNLIAMASNLLSSDGLQPTSDGLHPITKNTYQCFCEKHAPKETTINNAKKVPPSHTSCGCAPFRVPNLSLDPKLVQVSWSHAIAIPKIILIVAVNSHIIVTVTADCNSKEI